MKPVRYSHKDIEEKWQKKWNEKKTYSPNLSKSKKPFYNLMMFPYPSAEGLHAGNMFAFTGSDVYGRFKRMVRFDTFEPIGLDGFGIHSENYALKVGRTPQENATITQENYYKQLHQIGAGFDWSHTVETYNPDYYKWTQWLVKELFKAGLAYRKKAEVNFCPKDKTVLSDEQVMSPKQAVKDPIDKDGNLVEDIEGLRVCERCGTVVEKKELEVWFARITDYSERLLQNLTKLNWSDRVKIAQKAWIGKSEGRIIEFKKDLPAGEAGNSEVLSVFTTRPETLNSATFLVVADEELYNKHQKDKDKFGEFTGEYAINPLTSKKLPIWKANYIAPGYGTGVVMGVPGYDERDLAFAKKYKLTVLKEKFTDQILGKGHTNYHLRDWGIGRQRYWGPPMPMIYCKACASKGDGYLKNAKSLLHKDQSDWNWQGWWPEENLPVTLPVISDYKPEGNGRGPLANHPEFYRVACPKCGQEAQRETDVSDVFLDSSWYFLRYPSTDFNETPFDKKITEKWLPVDQYFGGAEHAVLHLMYSRFVTMVLNDLKIIDFEEPFPNFFAHGLVIKDGAKMSKSRGNVVNPDDYMNKFGADTLRTYLMFMGPMDSTMDFRDTGIEGMHRFIKRVWNLYTEPVSISSKLEESLQSKLHQTIHKVTKDIESFHYNTAISSIMELVNHLYEIKKESDDPTQTHDGGASTWHQALSVLCQLLAPFAPHVTEELWVQVLGEGFSVHLSKWPQYNSKYIRQEQLTIIVQVNGKMRAQIIVENYIGKDREKIQSLALKDEKVQKWVNGKNFKTIFIPNKIINFVVSA